MKISNLSYLETLSTEETQNPIGGGLGISLDASGQALGELTTVLSDLSALVVGHDKGAVGVATGVIQVHAKDPEEAITAAELEAAAKASITRQHSGSYSIDVGAEAYAGGFIVSIAID
ncbi:MAG: hypothetical protein WBA13_14685 [Microcoleaceae cyanobacterium]